MVGARILPACVLLFAAMLAACGGPTSAPSGPAETDAGYPVVVKDDVGRKVEIGSRPQSIGSMAPSVTETLFAVGAGDRVAGVTTADDFPEEARDLPAIGDYREPNVEKVLALKIDLLFVSFDSATRGFAEDLEDETGADVVVLNPTTVEDAVGSAARVGKAAGEPGRGRKLEQRLKKGLGAVERAVAGRREPTVFYEVWDDPLQTVGPGSFVHDAIDHAGGENIAAGTGEAYPSYSEETLLKKDPDYYLVSETTPEEVAERPAYSSLAAVENGNVSAIDPDLVSRPGPRLIRGVRAVAEVIHPDAFGGKAG